MKLYPDSISSKLPSTGTSIFAVMTQMAKEHDALNLSQGFPDFEVSPVLIELVAKHMRAGHNQYAPMPGLPALREAIAEKTLRLYDTEYDPDMEITVTAGATQAIYAAITAFVKDEDEVIVFEPAYDSYIPAVKLNGGVPITCKLKDPDFHIDWDEVTRLVSSRTKMIIINSPHNPTGSILRKEDLLQLEKLVKNTGILILSDEVYEHIIFEGEQHESVCRYPGLAERSLVTCSFGKTFHATGWKTGYCVAPSNLMKEFRKTHQFMVFCSNTPVQHALAEYLQKPDHYKGLGPFYQTKRDFFLKAVESSRFTFTPASGTYFQILNYKNISDDDEMAFAQWLTREHKIAAVPTSSFYNNPHNNHLLRFCFAKSEQTLKKAAEILCSI
ncbi:MAG: aminotransferase class I/II-fold pyridoxal phosphate-dependent enzyme [Bacteroidia bacterium]|nr:MAG: aminotransferase class I/II-fold pyridoxal phosphate-dependent enzyme [Bacteroidia bacterium]